MRRLVFIFSLALAFLPAVARAQVVVGARVQSPVSQKSQVVFADGRLKVFLKDASGKALANKRVSVLGAPNSERISNERGEAQFRVLPSPEIKIFQVVADREVALGTFASLAHKRWVWRWSSLAYAKELTRLEPAQISLALKAGKASKAEITVVNERDKNQDFEVSLKDYILLGRSGREVQFLDAGSQSDTIQSIVSYYPARFSLAPGESKKITLEVSVPDTTPAGKYKGAIVVQAVPNPAINAKRESTQISISTKVGSLVGIEVLGKNKTAAKIGSLANPPTGALFFVIIILASGLILREYYLFRQKRGVGKNGKKTLQKK